MRWALASLTLHAGLIATAWFAMQSQPEEVSLSEAAVSISVVSMEDAVTEPSETVSEASASLVSAGAPDATPEPVEPEPVDAVEAILPEPVQVQAAAAPVAEAVQPTETEDLVSAAVLTALREVDAIPAEPLPQVTSDAAMTVVETVAPSDAAIVERIDAATTLAELAPTQENPPLTPAPISPTTPIEPVTIAEIAPVVEEVVEVPEAPPVPRPRLERKPEVVEKPVEKPADKPPAEKKTAEKPVEKKQPRKVASAGSGGADEADAATAKAAGGTEGNVASIGQGAIDAYQGKVRSRLLKAVRKPKGSKGGEARVMFTLDAGGRVLSAKLSKNSGDDRLDQAALAAVERAAPYPPIPDGAGKSTWSFTIPIAIN